MNNEKKWVCGWGAATSYIAETQANYMMDTTCRYKIIPTMSASKIRLHFSNMFGTEEAELSCVTVADAHGESDIDKDTITSITFGGSKSKILGIGEIDIVSDEIDFNVVAEKEFIVSIYFSKMTKLNTGHSNGGKYIKNYYARGNHTTTSKISSDIYVEGGAYLFLNTIDFLCTDECAAIIAFGDSITALSWPDILNNLLNKEANGKRSVIRRAVGGNRVLNEYSVVRIRRFGPAGVSRFEKDVCKTDGVKAVIVLHGINDLIHPSVNSSACPISMLPTSDEVIEGYKLYVKLAHESGIKIYFATLLPTPRLSTAIRGRTRSTVTRLRFTMTIGVLQFRQIRQAR